LLKSILSMSIEDDVKGRALKREARLVMEIFKARLPFRGFAASTEIEEWVVGSYKEQCVHRQRFKTLRHASRVIGDWIGICKQRRTHQSLKVKTPNQVFEMFRLAA